MNKVKLLFFACFGLLALHFGSAQAITLNAEENTTETISEDVSEDVIFEQKEYTHQDESGYLKITLLSETECNIYVEYQGEIYDKNIPYTLEENVLTIYGGEENNESLSFIVLEDGTLDFYEKVDDLEEQKTIEDYIAEVEELKNKILNYQDYIENDTIRIIIESIITFIVLLVARLIENKSLHKLFGSATETLNKSNDENIAAKKSIKDAEKEFKEQIKNFKNEAVDELNKAIAEIKNENHNSKEVFDLVKVGFNTINAVLLKSQSENQKLKDELSQVKELLNKALTNQVIKQGDVEDETTNS